ncbi:hypothetical protein LCGC14_1083770 [marine sediment metagenome]|uniref:Uncharacterized protein n=1 Tax=marine sediment metagenome TaxID=412755 RepID=A0A0F9PXP1_9ZZZZ
MKIRVDAKNVNEDVLLSFAKYGDGSVAIQAVSLDQEPMFTATACINEPAKEGHVFLKGWSENEGIPEALVKAGVVELTGRTVSTGYCEAIEAKLLKTD